jgi:hypothetical protein
MRGPLAPQHAPGGELGGRFDPARHDQRQDPRAQMNRGTREQFLHPVAARRAQHRRHMPMGGRALDDKTTRRLGASFLSPRRKASMRASGQSVRSAKVRAS